MPANLPEPAPNVVLASDTERERVISKLNTAVSDGRITLSEFSDRTQAVYATRTRAELEQYVEDLPPMDDAGGPEAHGVVADLDDVVVIGPIKRYGRWRVPRHSSFTTNIGTIKLDLSDALLTSSEVTIHAQVNIGTIKIVVPDNVRLRVTGNSVIGGRSVDANDLPANMNVPTVHFDLSTIIGTVKIHVQRKGRGRARYF